jgi:hypothetical protein
MHTKCNDNLANIHLSSVGSTGIFNNVSLITSQWWSVLLVEFGNHVVLKENHCTQRKPQSYLKSQINFITLYRVSIKLTTPVNTSQLCRSRSFIKTI